MMNSRQSRQLSGYVELHRHLDGSIRPSTLFELCREKSLLPPGVTTLEQFVSYVTVDANCHSLVEFLSKFKQITPALAGDLKAIARITREVVDDLWNEGHLYTELRYAPHLFLAQEDIANYDKLVEVVELVNETVFTQSALQEMDVRVILCIMRNMPQTAMAVAKVAFENNTYQGKKLTVGIDLAGDETDFPVQIGGEIQNAYEFAFRNGVHRTVHAGESSSANEILTALKQLHAERIGHGYRAFWVKEGDDAIIAAQVQQLLKKKDIHLEMCITSSELLKNVPADQRDHPILQVLSGHQSVSLSTDDPGVMQTTIGNEQEVMNGKVFSDPRQNFLLNFEALRHAFVSEEEKMKLIKNII